jgi:hypothetical protein
MNRGSWFGDLLQRFLPPKAQLGNPKLGKFFFRINGPVMTLTPLVSLA